MTFKLNVSGLSQTLSNTRNWNAKRLAWWFPYSLICGNFVVCAKRYWTEFSIWRRIIDLVSFETHTRETFSKHTLKGCADSPSTARFSQYSSVSLGKSWYCHCTEDTDLEYKTTKARQNRVCMLRNNLDIPFDSTVVGPHSDHCDGSVRQGYISFIPVPTTTRVRSDHRHSTWCPWKNSHDHKSP